MAEAIPTHWPLVITDNVVALQPDRLPTGCIEWTGPTAKGYARATVYGERCQVHIWTYVDRSGPYDEGLELDHLCHNADPDCDGGKNCPHRRCVNPDHLEPVTHLVNVRRGKGGRHNGIKTHCPAGHEYTEANTYVRRCGKRHCRTCERERGRRRRRA